MKKPYIILMIMLVVLIGAGYFLMGGGSNEDLKKRSGAKPESISEIAAYKYTQTYEDPVRGFSFRYPEDFKVTQIPGDNSQTILVQNLEKKVGLQVIISPFDGSDTDITPEVVADNIPDMNISNTQMASIGQSGRGLMFTSDSDAFGGKSREIWFVVGGNLYQMSTYFEFGPFLEGLFKTLTFK